MINREKFLQLLKKAREWGERDPFVAFPVACGLFFMLVAVVAVFCGWQEAARNIIYIAVAFGGACGLILTLRRTEALTRQADMATKQTEIAAKQANTAERNLVVERFTRAVGQLGDESNLAVRVGGIYSLEMIARTSEEERDAAIQTIAVFVRSRSPNTMSDMDANGEPKILDKQEQEQRRSERLDVEIAIHVLARLVKKEERIGVKINLDRTNLTSLDLSNCNLTFFNFGIVNFSHANLFGSDLSHAFLFGSKLNFAVLNRATFSGTTVSNANFYRVMGLNSNSLESVKYSGDTRPQNVPENVQLPLPTLND